MKHFHGQGKTTSFFEGWYLKHQKQDMSLALIPAVHIDKRGHKEASLQIITKDAADCIHVPFKEFYASSKQFHVSLGSNSFSPQGIYLNLKSRHFEIKGQLSYGTFTPLKYDIMGPFRFIPNMQCNHGVLSLNHSLSGSLNINGQLYDFTDGFGYIEKDWGNSFPQSYLWTQSIQANPYQQQPSSIMVSLAHIPFGPFRFTGCIAVVYYGKTEYRFATYKGVKILEYTSRSVILKQGSCILHVHLLKDAPQPLNAPAFGEMSRTIHESLACKVRYQFFINRKKIFDIINSDASFERSNECSQNSSRHCRTNPT